MYTHLARAQWVKSSSVVAYSATTSSSPHAVLVTPPNPSSPGGGSRLCSVRYISGRPFRRTRNMLWPIGELANRPKTDLTTRAMF